MALARLAAGVRGAGLAVALVVAAATGRLSLPVAAGVLALAVTALWQTRRARRPGADDPADPPLGSFVEVALATVAVASTGSWGSPLAFCLLASVMAVGLTRGFGPALGLAVGATVATSTVLFLQVGGVVWAGVGASGQWTAEIVLVALLAGYTRRIFGEAERRYSVALDRMSRLSEANELLVSLHRVAQSLPASLNLSEVLASTVTRLRSLIDCDVVGILLRDEGTGGWTVAAGEGAALPAAIGEENLPDPLRAATTSSVASLVVSLATGEGLGPEILARSGLYAPLRARGALIGVLALEHHEAGFYGRSDLRLLDGFIETASLALDNARWFARLRTMGADEERTRIARDMHDSVGQSLASVAFRLDRLTSMARGHPLHPELAVLRGEVRSVLADVRDTLCDLRTDVTDRSDLADTLASFLERVGERAGLEVSFRHESSGRLPVLVERELWRIAHEAVSNVERHAGARHLQVGWECDGSRGRLTVADDGHGLVSGPSRPDAYGIRGMRERAEAIGAGFDIRSEPDGGTTVECRLPAARSGTVEAA